MLLQGVDERHLAHVLGQVALFDQTAQGVSCCGFGIAEDGGGLFAWSCTICVGATFAAI